MAQQRKEVRRNALSMSVDECRVRVQTGQATVFVDARKAEDRAASDLQIVGSIRFSLDDRACQPPLHQRSYIVVYCA
jgi:hypothetical protein